jgi:glyoxylase-like metal-dependent hydrolase (beta-lactamase superfamily II)
MIHEVIAVGLLQCNCSILGDETTGEGMVIDPGDEIERVLDVLSRYDLKLKQIVVTHAHIDHVGGAMRLKRLTGAPILLNQKDEALLKMLGTQASWIGAQQPEAVKVDQDLADGSSVQLGSYSASVLHTPGHTEGSVCLYFEPQQKLIAGDTLFAGSIGRTDLPGGSYEKIISSLHERVLPLPDDVEVTPGHGPLTYIGVERESNPFLQ